MIHIENLVKRYGDLVALNHLSLDIKEGEIFGLLGPNGSGKTTAINCLLSLLKYDKGDIEIFGQKMTPDNYEVKQQIGIVLQNVAVFDELTVSENIDYFCGLYIHGKNRRRGISSFFLEMQLSLKPDVSAEAPSDSRFTQKIFFIHADIKLHVIALYGHLNQFLICHLIASMMYFPDFSQNSILVTLNSVRHKV